MSEPGKFKRLSYLLIAFMSISQTLFIGVSASGDMLQFPCQAFQSIPLDMSYKILLVSFYHYTKNNSEENELG